MIRVLTIDNHEFEYPTGTEVRTSGVGTPWVWLYDAEGHLIAVHSAYTTLAIEPPQPGNPHA